MKIRLLADPEVAERLAPLCRASGWPLETSAPDHPYRAGTADVVLVSVIGDQGLSRLRAVQAAEPETVELVALARSTALPEVAEIIAAGATELVLIDSADPVIAARLGFLEARLGRQRRTHFRGVPLDKVLEFAGDAVEIVDPDIVIQYVNPAFERITGYRRDEAIGKTPRELLSSGRHAPGFFEDMFETMARGETWRGTLISHGKDGRTLHLDTTLAPIFDRTGRLTHRVAVKRDITEQIEQQRRIHESEERHALALRGANEILFDWDLAGDRLMLSARFWEMLDLEMPRGTPSAGHVVEMETLLRRLHPADSARTRAQLEAALEDPHRHRFETECRLIDASGQSRWMLVRGLLLRGLADGSEGSKGAGPAYRMAGSMAEISGLKRAHEELSLTRDQAVAASAAKSQFLANMSHELRTPLGAIIGYSEMLIEDTLGSGDPEVRQRKSDLERIRSAGRMLLDLINGILDISKIEAGRMELHLELLRLEEILEMVAAALLPACDRSGNRFEVVIPERLEAIRCDATKLRQVLLNLLSNANKFTQAGNVTLTVLQDEVQTVFQVKDTGVGIAPEVLPRLFQPFVQGDASTTRQYGGTGLGLAISRRLCRLMGGELTCQSQPGVGSTFVATLPRHPEAPVAAVERGAGAAAPGGLLVLCIDDDRETRQGYAESLRAAGFATLGARGGEEGLRLAKEKLPDAIVLDLMMPDMNGFDVLERLKAEPLTAGIPVVMASAAREQARALALGAEEYLQKPVDGERLLGVLGRFRRPRPPRPVLLVEDDAATAELTRRTLESAGWAVEVASDGNRALQALATLVPDVLVLDLMMPGMDGFELLDRLRATPETRALPVVVVTAKELTSDERRLLAGATQKVLCKGQMKMTDLVGEIERVLARCALPAA